ncbi:MAG: hypothetical protein E7198_10855 [Schwartzia succinivorans]|jgi:hypothetical protein|uniref:hypothetical protein n=1 Tax=Schwartzia succinivorans TaxID=55507 RepID=UPI002357A342|nr:hypothetical protein [Schwartzia succinivorans]MBE6098266.1 hypothetical protein [Schwartzia succinivorans]
MALADPALSAANSAATASVVARRNADKLEKIDDTTEGTFIVVEASGKLLMKIADKIDAIAAENKELRNEIMALKEQIKTPAPYVR